MRKLETSNMQAPKIFKLSDVPEPKRTAIQEAIDGSPEFLKPTEEFDENGLRFPVDHLKAIGGGIVFLPLEYTALYVDVITKQNVDKGDTVGDFSHQGFELWNTTSVGNVAYCALNSRNLPEKQVALRLLQAYADYYFEQLSRGVEFTKK